MRLKDKVAIITGATGGIGGAATRLFVKEGAKVLAVGRNTDALDALKAELGEAVATHAADISSEDDTKAFVQAALDAFGRIDVLFANAGYEGQVSPLTELSVEQFDKTWSVNVRGSWLSVKHAAPHMAKSGGSIILTSSVAGKVGVAGLSAYASSKHGLIGLTHVAALELAPLGIRVNAIAPAPIDNAMMEKLHEQAAPGAPEAAEAGFKALVPMGRYGEDEEVAAMALFLASDEARFCTGGTYPVDGGFLAQ